MTEQLTIFDQSNPPSVPIELFKCPICGKRIVIDDIDEIEQEENGRWKVSDGGLHVTCETEPDMDSDDWDDWFDWHFSMPYVDWLPVQHQVLDWLNSNYQVNHS